VDRDDVRVLQLSNELDLASEPIRARCRRELGGQYFHDDLAVE
jgi:hypothetical protein